VRSPSPARALAALALALLFAMAGATPVQAQADPREFSETGYRVSNDAFWDYFTHRGGVRTFGYPISRQFTLLGLPVQLFQRAALQQQPDGSVAILNLLDPGLMPYQHANGSTFPAPDPALAMVAPSPDQPEYAARMQEFLRAEVPDTWNGLPVGFRSAFLGTVDCSDAFPSGGCRQDLLPLLNLEIWGAPTSSPEYDPGNHDFVYQRFQRGILHYDAGCGCTQGVLLADYFKSILTGQNLPADLALEAAGSPFFHQYLPAAPGWVARPAALPATDLTDAFVSDVPS
jgi:hypothetical protein